MTGSFYFPLGDERWRATKHTTGPWDARAQHGGPPSALMARAIQRCAPRDDMIVSRFTCDILGAIPVGDVEVRASMARPGRSVEMLEAVLRAGGRTVAQARAWRVLRTSSPPVRARHSPVPALPVPPNGTAPGGSPAVPPGGQAVPPGGAGVPGETPAWPPTGWVDGYMSAIEWRPVRGAVGMPGPATVWARLRYPLVAEEEPTPLQRVLVLADSANGVAAELASDRWQFINPELTVHLHRDAAGEWICLDAATAISTAGAGLATSVLFDQDGPVGVTAQSLLVAPRTRR